MTIKHIIEKDGTEKWFNEEGQLHRDDGPTYIGYDDHQVWYQNGQLHRLDGPAIITSTGWQLFYEKGKYLYCKSPKPDSIQADIPCDICLVKCCCKIKINQTCVITAFYRISK